MRDSRTEENYKIQEPEPDLGSWAGAGVSVIGGYYRVKAM